MRNREIDEGVDEEVELGADPSVVNQVRVIVGVGGGGGRRRVREVREESGEEGLEREEGFKDVRRRRGWGNVGEKKREVVDVSSGGEELVA